MSAKLLDKWRAFEVTPEDTKHFHPRTSHERIADTAAGVGQWILRHSRKAAGTSARVVRHLYRKAKQGTAKWKGNQN